jgi:catechol 2,3-dioxygenase-like lactoylglutathione lyase family enzyme
MIDHIGISVSDFARSRAFYVKALAPLGYAPLMEFSAAVTGHVDVAGFGVAPKPDFWISGGKPRARRRVLRRGGRRRRP